MNTDTGEVYRGLTEENPNIVPVSEDVADAVEIGIKALNRAERRYQEKMARRQA